MSKFIWDDSGLGSLIWETSIEDEGTISATGANIVAQAILGSDWLKKHDAEIREQAIKDVWAGVDAAYAQEIGAR